MKITVISNPFMEIPPSAIGAMEILWHDLVKEFFHKGHDAKIYGKGNLKLTQDWAIYLNGFLQSRNVLINLIKTFVFDFIIMWRMPKTDVLVVNNILGPFVPIFFFWKYKKLVYNAARTPKSFYRFFNAVHGICCPSSPIERITHNYLPQKNVVTIPNPIDTTCFYKMNIQKVDDVIRIGYHGRIHPEKGVHLLATAVKELQVCYPKLKLRLIGTLDLSKGGGGDDYRVKLETLLPNQIEWIKPIANREELAKVIAECDLYCYPSLAEIGETFGVSPLEAMGVAKPVIVSNLACFKDFVEDGKNALIFDHRCEMPTEALKERIKSLLNNHKLANTLADQASQTAKTYSNAVIADAYLKWFNVLLKD